MKCGAAWGALQGDGADAFCLIDGRVFFEEFFGGAFGGAGVQALLSGVYAGVFMFLTGNEKQNHSWFFFGGGLLKKKTPPLICRRIETAFTHCKERRNHSLACASGLLEGDTLPLTQNGCLKGEWHPCFPWILRTPKSHKRGFLSFPHLELCYTDLPSLWGVLLGHDMNDKQGVIEHMSGPSFFGVGTLLGLVRESKANHRAWGSPILRQAHIRHVRGGSIFSCLRSEFLLRDSMSFTAIG